MSDTEHAGAAWITDVLWPGATLSTARVADAAARLIAVPSAAAPTQLLPAAWTSVIAVAQRPSDDRPRSKAWRDAAGIAGLVAAARFDARRRLSVSGDAGASLVAHLGREIDARITGAVVLCGPARANRKPVLQLHDRRGRTIAFAKVAWNQLTRDLLAHERNALHHVGARVGTELRVPEMLGAGTFEGADWVALGPVGVDRRERPSEATSFRMARVIERTADEVRGSGADNPFVHRIRTASAGLPRGSEVVAALVDDPQREQLVLRAAHGDFVPWNTLSGAPCPAVWDWERYQQHAPAGYDRFHHVFQTAIFRRGLSVTAAIAALDARLAEVAGDLGDAARLHLDWYLADLLCRYEHDARPSSPPSTPQAAAPEHVSLMARVTEMATVMEQRRSRR